MRGIVGLLLNCLVQVAVAQVLCANEPSTKCASMPPYALSKDQRYKRSCVQECQPTCEEDCKKEFGDIRHLYAATQETIQWRMQQEQQRQTGVYRNTEVWYDQPWLNKWQTSLSKPNSNSSIAVSLRRTRDRALQEETPAPAPAPATPEAETPGAETPAAGTPAPVQLEGTRFDRGECTLLQTVAYCASFSDDIDGCKNARDEGFGCMPCPNYKTFSGYRDLCRTALQCSVTVIWDGVETTDIQAGCESPLGAGSTLHCGLALLLPLLLSAVLTVH